MKNLNLIIIAIFAFYVSNAQWQAVPLANNNWIYSSAADSNKIVVGTSSGIFISTDYGVNWIYADSSTAAKNIERIIIKGDSIFACSFNGVFLTTNNALSWTTMNTGLTDIDVRAMAKDGNKIYAGTSNGNIFFSNNSAGSWTNLNTGFVNTHIKDLFINGNNVYAATNRGVYITSNNGLSWNQLNIGLIDTNITRLSKSGNNILAGTYKGDVYVSSNNGNNWNLVLTSTWPYNAGWSITTFATIADTVYASLTLRGVFRSTDHGNTWLFTNHGMLDSVNTITICGNNVFAGTWNGLCKHSFADFWKKCIITTISSPLVGGTTTGGGLYTIYYPCTVKAIANQSYSFSNWSVNQFNYYWLTDTVYTFTVVDNWTMKANFNISAIAAGTITGDTLFCAPVNDKAYYVAPISGVLNDSTGYEWNYTGNLATLRRSITGDTVYINFSQIGHGGYLTVRGKSASGYGPASPALHINVISASNGFGYSGNTVFCTPDTVNINIISEPYTTYSWNINSIPGITVLNTTPTSCSLYANLTPGNNAFIYFNSTNMCGTNSNSILIKPQGLPLNPGIITGSAYVYTGQQNVVYMVPQSANNLLSYLWTLPVGVSGYSNQNNIIANFSSMAVSGNISVKAMNICGMGPSSSFYVNVSPVIPNCSAQFSMVADTNVLHHYFVVNNASGIHPLHYVWNWGDGTQDTLAYPSHTYSNAGYYNICLTIIDSVGCTNSYCNFSYLQKSPNTIISLQVIPQGSLDINEHIVKNDIKIYPNPAKDYIIIKSNSKTKQDYTIYNLIGQIIYTSSVIEKASIDISDFKKGIYIVKIDTDKEAVFKKFVKE